MAPKGTDVVLSTFQPTQEHVWALEAYVESGGSVSIAAEESGLSVPQILRALRSSWWQDQIKQAEFKPITSKELGARLKAEAGHRALQVLESQGQNLDLDDLVKITRIGKDLCDAGSAGSGGGSRFRILAEIDFRGMEREVLMALRGTAVSEDVIEVEVLDEDGDE